jgi:SAM-dependent methyltransferase
MWDDPDLYDLENADDPAFDVGYWSRLVRELAPARMLELACGTGRLLLPLARLGVASSVVGLDLSEPFVERAAARLAAEPASVRDAVSVVVGDMRSPGFEPGSFDLVLITFNALAYLETRDDRRAALRAVRGLLAPGGVFAFDLIQPRYDFLSEAMEPRAPLRVDADHAAPALGVTRFLRSYSDRYDPATQTLHSTNRYEILRADGRVDHRIADLDWHIYFPEELELLLEAAGLRVTTRYGSYEREPWSSRSRRYLWLADGGSGLAPEPSPDDDGR